MDTPPAQGNRRLRTRLLLAAAAVIAGAGLIWAGQYWFVGRFRESTDDAYLQADSTVIAPQVSGTVATLKVADNQQVKAGDVLLTLDDSTYRAREAQAEAEANAAQADLDHADAEIARQQATIDQAEAQAQFAKADAARYAKLVKQGGASEQAVQKSRTESKSSSASLEMARRELAVLKAQREKAAASVEQAKAALTQAKINLANTTLTAPADGVVADRTVERGQYVTTGQRLLTIVPLQSVYLIANFKETQIAHMRPGQKVSIAIDAYPGVTFKGRVNSLSPGTGAEFALLPPENATGNFTKIVQRVPVKIVFDHDDAKLRPGLSATATVHTGDRS